MFGLREAIDWTKAFAWERIDSVLLQGTSRLCWLYLLSALGLAAAVFLWHESRAARPRFSRILRFLFPRAIWLHRSALIDYGFVVSNSILLALCVTPWIVSGCTIGGQVGRFWHWLVGPVGAAELSPLAVNVAYTLALLLVGDFVAYVVHLAFHRLPLLWQFHKVHHSCTVLTPLSAFRLHPIEQYINLTALAAAFGLVTGSFNHFQPLSMTAVTILGVNVGIFAFDILGSNLSHSHVWLHWGNILGRVVISPAQHQIHHSDNPKHFGTNYGIIFALWDWLFGTLYLPRQRESLSFGLGNRENEEFRSVWRIYWHPFARAWRMIAAGFRAADTEKRG